MILLGQCIFAFGTAIQSLPVMLAGRVVFGFGGESVTVATSNLMAIWFADKELALALGINLGVSRLGGVANNFVSPILWDKNHTCVCPQLRCDVLVYMCS
jgi:nitrate/nitrite transporter NarK